MLCLLDANTKQLEWKNRLSKEKTKWFVYMIYSSARFICARKGGFKDNYANTKVDNHNVTVPTFLYLPIDVLTYDHISYFTHL